MAINLQNAKKVVILGGGTAGWYAALALRQIFSPKVEVQVIESSQVGIVGVGEGGLLNFISALKFVNIDLAEFKAATNATHKWGFSYEGWRTGKEDDKFYHPFGSAQGVAAKWNDNGHFPLFSAMINQGIDLDSYIRGMDLIKNNATQKEADAALKADAVDIIDSVHFDSYKTANFLKKTALSRNITHMDALIDQVITDENGNVTRLITENNEKIELDFIVDASGLARKIIGKAVPAKWQSFKEHLILDRAIPFYMPHPKKNPYLVSRAIALNSGWMWQIPLTDRVGAGYVYSSGHISDEDAQQELKDYLGFDVDIQKIIKFDPGCHEKIWVNNVLAIGLAAGFVEPLEATSIAQMVEVIRNFCRILMLSQGVISDNTVREFNEANLHSWYGIRDFLRMHYDTPRNDTPFWQDVAKIPYPETYRAFREVMQYRAPRLLDIENYAIYGWHGIFHSINWMFVATPLGILKPNAVTNDLMSMSPEKREEADKFLLWLRSNMQK